MMKKYILPLLLCVSGSIVEGGQQQPPKVYTYQVKRNQAFTVKFPAIRDDERKDSYIEYKTNRVTQKEQPLPINETFSRTYHARPGGTITFHRPGHADIIYHLEIAPELK